MTADSLLKDNPIWIVDVGASGGIDKRWQALTPHYKGILFEPDPREYDTLTATADHNLIVLNTALSDRAMSLQFNLCAKQEVSSVFRPNKKILNQFPNADRFDIVKTIQLEADSLNSQLQKRQIFDLDFIKVDAQGYELPILSGCNGYLSQVVGLEVEVEFIEIYENQPLFHDVDRFVQSMGFSLVDLKRYYWKRKQTINTGCQKGQLIFGDALYFRPPEAILSMDHMNEEKLVRSIFVYLGYGYWDLAQTLFRAACDAGLICTRTKEKLEKLLMRRSRKSIPNFRGKRKVQRFLEKISTLFCVQGVSSGSDRRLGNPACKFSKNEDDHVIVCPKGNSDAN